MPSLPGPRPISLIETQNITLTFGSKVVLSDVTFASDAGEIVTIVGPNGSGKSSLLLALIGALRPTFGTVTRKAGLKIGYVPQKLHIDATPPLTVHRFLNLPKTPESRRPESGPRARRCAGT